MNAVRATSSVLLLLAVSAAGQQQAWGQCGGIGYSGASSCVDGYFCTSYNPYYYQCYPGTSVGAVSSTTTSSPTTITTTTTTVKVTTTTTTTTTTTPKATTTSARTTASTATSVSHTTTSSSPSGTAGSSFAKTNGLFFDIDGVTQYYAGTNCYWCGFLTANGDVDHVLSDIAASGLKILRVWGFNDVTTIPSSGTVWYQYLSASGSQINTGADGLQRLDYVVQAAEANDLKLIINFVNNWSDYGGMAAYVTAFGGNTSTWYTNAAAQAQYQAYIKAVVSRYKTSTAVFAWELANEPRCSGCDVSVIYNWANATSHYIKSLDPNHMVTMGDEGFGPLAGGDGSYPFTTAAGGYDWQTDLDIPTLDFGTLHLYPDSWGEPMSWGTLWVTTHGSACANASKPCLLEEYGGENSCANENPWQEAALATKGIAGDMFWQYGDTLPSCNCQTSQDGNTVYYNGTNWDCMVTQHIAAIEAKNA